MKRFQTTITKKIQLSPQTFELHIQTPEDFTFKAGQFITFIMEKDGKRFPRSYSILNPPKEKQLRLCVKFLEGGIASTAFKEATTQTQFNCIGPVGPFVFDEETTNKHVLIGTDTGIAPLNAMLYEFINTNREFELIFGARTKEDLYYHEQYKELEKNNTNFIYKPTLSRQEVEGIAKGYVQKLLPTDLTNTTFYICGNKEMVIQTIELLKEKGVNENDIRYERFS